MICIRFNQFLCFKFRLFIGIVKTDLQTFNFRCITTTFQCFILQLGTVFLNGIIVTDALKFFPEFHRRPFSLDCCTLGCNRNLIIYIL